MQLDVSGYDAVGNRIRLGMIAADQVLTGAAQVDGMSMFDVCDQDSILLGLGVAAVRAK